MFSIHMYIYIYIYMFGGAAHLVGGYLELEMIGGVVQLFGGCFQLFGRVAQLLARCSELFGGANQFVGGCFELCGGAVNCMVAVFELFGEAAQLFAGCVELSGGLLSYLYLFGVIYIHLFCIKTGATGEVEWLRGRPTGSLVVEYHCSQPTRQDNACRFICFLFLFLVVLFCTYLCSFPTLCRLDRRSHSILKVNACQIFQYFLLLFVCFRFVLLCAYLCY